MNRNRVHQLFLMAVFVVIGIASRKYRTILPDLIGEYAGDIIWSLMVFWLFGFIFPSKSTRWVAVFALVFSYFIELTQLYHAPFIDAIRATTLGGLIFGYTFIWSDLICYTIGVFTGALIEKLRF